MAPLSRLVLTWLATSGLVAARVVPQTHVLHEARNEHPSIIKRGRLDPDTPLVLKMAMKQSNLHRAEAWLNEVAHPDSPNFAKYWTPEEVIEAFRPPDEAVESVLLWLASLGIERHRVTHSDNKQWLVLDVTAKQAEDMFHTDYHEYHDLKGRSLAGADHIHLPRHLASAVDFVKPGVKSSLLPPRGSKDLTTRDEKPGASKHRRPKVSTQSSESLLQMTQTNASDLSNCHHEMNHHCLAATLNMPLQATTLSSGPQNTFGTLEWGQYFEQRDLDSFWNEFFPETMPKGTAPIVARIDGGLTWPELWNFQGNGGGEIVLDLQTTMPFYYPNRVTDIQVDDEYYAETPSDPALLTPLFDAIDGSFCTKCDQGICGNDPKLDPVYPDTVSNYGGGLYKGQYQCGTFQAPAVLASAYYTPIGEPDAHHLAHATRLCDEVLKLGLQGTTIAFASGDDGVGYGDTCTTFDYSYPNGCPWLLIVGGTMLGAGKSVTDTPVVWQTGSAGTQPWTSPFASGSGFSQFFARQDYQKDVVDAYLAKHDPGYPYWTGLNYNHTKPGLYSRDGRAYPDVAADAGPIGQYLAGTRVQDGGTSESVQLWGVMLARIVDERRKAGKANPNLGIVHHTLYAHPEVFKDVVSGSNPGCGTQGWPADEGWDLPSGLGSPDYAKLLALYLSLP